MEVAAVGPQLENELEATFAGTLTQHAEALGGLGVAAFLPEVDSLFGFGLGPVGTDQQGVGVVGNLDFPDGGLHVVILLPEVVRKAVAEA